MSNWVLESIQPYSVVGMSLLCSVGNQISLDKYYIRLQGSWQTLWLVVCTMDLLLFLWSSFNVDFLNLVYLLFKHFLSHGKRNSCHLSSMSGLWPGGLVWAAWVFIILRFLAPNKNQLLSNLYVICDFPLCGIEALNDCVNSSNVALLWCSCTVGLLIHPHQRLVAN